MKFQSHIQHAIMVVASVLVAACGGGAQTDPNAGGALSVAPAEGTFYAGVPGIITISGGRMPYSLNSSEPTILPVPSQVNSHSITLLGNNPGVVDSGLPAGSLQIRTVNITVTDNSAGSPQTIKIHVAQNFLLGYGVSFKSNCPSTTSACAGGQVAAGFFDVTNGVLSGNRTLRFIVMRGPFKWVFPTGGTGTSVDLVTDHTGFVQAIFQVDSGVATQLAVMRIQDVSTGVYTDEVFTIAGSVSTALTVLPNNLDFVGVLKGVCGTGSGDVLVFDGQPPYSAVSADPNVTVSPAAPATVNTQPGKFTISATNPNLPCLPGSTVTFQDSNQVRTTVTVKTEVGSGSPPAPALSVTPTSLAIGCNSSGSVTVIGGASTSYSASSTNATVTTAVSGNTLTITRAGPAGPGSGGTTTVSINVTDGASIVQVSATVPVTCP